MGLTKADTVIMVELGTRPRPSAPRFRGKNRITKHIGRKPAANVLNATNMAARLGHPLNWLATFNLGQLACPAGSESELFQRFLKHFARVLRRCHRGKACVPYYVWTLENALTLGVHVHWLVHIPRGWESDFNRLVASWFCGVESGSTSGEIDVTSAYHPAGAARYILKGMSPADAGLYGIRHVSQGRVRGKRSGFSRSLGPAARKRLEADGRLPPLRRPGRPANY